MTNDEIGDALKLTAQLMELHNENPFKIRALNNISFNLSKVTSSLAGLTLDQLEKMDGIGKGIANAILELNKTGTTKELKALIKKTPTGVIEMLSIKGIGPKKVGALWRELGIETIGELLYACEENRLVTLKGFGEKTQTSVKQNIEFKLANAGKFHYARALGAAQEIIGQLQKQARPGDLISFTGAIRRRCEIIEKIELLADDGAKIDPASLENSVGIKVELTRSGKKEFAAALFRTTASADHLTQLKLKKTDLNFNSEKEIYASLGMQYILPELREGLGEIELAKKNSIPKLVELSDLKGILHNHTTYSDGLNTLRQMAEECKKRGYEYLGICDHSRSAFYANGLEPNRVLAQQKEIDALNKELAPFRIFKGIESDILNDGSLDYDKSILKTFDMVVASVHSVLKMDKDRATKRLIKAIENPYTTILGHPTGRLILMRAGYPIDHKKVIDACAANGVIMELNANPYRLDIDWRWISHCVKKKVMISINPDAHELEGYDDMFFGVCAARKGMLTKEMCFNALTLEEMEKHLLSKKS